MSFYTTSLESEHWGRGPSSYDWNLLIIVTGTESPEGVPIDVLITKRADITVTEVSELHIVKLTSDNRQCSCLFSPVSELLQPQLKWRM